jgi:hypothetical protein
MDKQGKRELLAFLRMGKRGTIEKVKHGFEGGTCDRVKVR